MVDRCRPEADKTAHTKSEQHTIAESPKVARIPGRLTSAYKLTLGEPLLNEQ